MSDANGSIFEHLDDAKMLKILPESLEQTYKHGIETEKIDLYETTAIHIIHEHGVDYSIHIIPSLDEKPPPSKELPDLESKPKKDPFQPPFVPEELVGELDKYSILLNRFCFLPKQFVLATKHWAVQAQRMGPQDLQIAWQVVESFGRDAHRNIFAFYNCGKRSGASQPHRHVQFVPCPDDAPVPPVQRLVESLGITYSGCNQEPTSLPLPYLHLVSALPPPTDALTPIPASTLSSIYARHLALHPTSSDSHNVLLTRTHLHTIPRSERDNHLAVMLDGEEKKLTVGPNGLGFAGYFFVKPGDERILEKWGVTRAWRGVGYAPEERRAVE